MDYLDNANYKPSQPLPDVKSEKPPKKAEQDKNESKKNVAKDIFEKSNNPVPTPITKDSHQLSPPENKTETDQKIGKLLEKWVNPDWIEKEGEDVYSQEGLDGVIEEYFFEEDDESASVFQNTDLVVFKDSYQGPMPINGIKETDFKEIEKLFHSIKSGNTKLQISGDTDFSEKTLDSIKTLLTRELGRKIVKILCTIPVPLVLKSAKESGGEGTRHVRSSNIIYLDHDDDSRGRWIGIDAQDTRLIAPFLPHVVLGHEMIHAIHYYRDISTPKNKSTMDSEYDNLEERITITGLKDNLKMAEAQTPPTMDMDIDDKPAKIDYDELNERNLSAAFAKEGHWLARVGHGGVYAEEEGLNLFVMSCIKLRVWGELARVLKERKPEEIYSKETLDRFNKFPQIFKEHEFLLGLLKWNAKLNFDQIAGILERMPEPSSEFLSAKINEFNKLEDPQLEGFFNKLITDIVKNTKISDENKQIFETLFNNEKELAEYYIDNFTKYDNKNLLLSYLLDHPDLLKRLPDPQKEPAKKIITELTAITTDFKPNDHDLMLLKSKIKSNQLEFFFKTYVEYFCKKIIEHEIVKNEKFVNNKMYPLIFQEVIEDQVLLFQKASRHLSNDLNETGILNTLIDVLIVRLKMPEVRNKIITEEDKTNVKELINYLAQYKKENKSALYYNNMNAIMFGGIGEFFEECKQAHFNQ